MISAKVFAKTAEKFVTDNAPVILTTVGAVGSVAATVLGVKATVTAVGKISEEETRRYQMAVEVKPDTKLSKTEIVKLVWIDYIPATGVLAISVGAIVCANRVSTKRAAAMALAYSLGERNFSEYKTKVAEKFNTNKEQQVRDEIAQDRVSNNPNNQVIIVGNGDMLCYDMPSDRYFQSSVQKIRAIENNLNAEVCEFGFAHLDAFYVAIGLNPTPYSEEMGWTTDKLFKIDIATVLSPNDEPCITLNYTVNPTRYDKRGCSEEPPF